MANGTRQHALNCHQTLVFTLVFILTSVCGSLAECTAGQFNLTAIQMWGTWTAQSTIEGVQSKFSLNLCENVSNAACGADVSACLEQGSAVTNVGGHNETLAMTANENTGGFRMDYRGGECNTTEKWQTTIEFKCGTTLGSPNFLEKAGCTYFFEWYSTVACSAVRDPAISEVPCSVYDSKGKKRDLSPLIKLHGGYLVESADADDLYINVCRDITAETSGPTLGCPEGAAGCLVKHGISPGMGEAHQKLQLRSDDELQLQYAAKEVQPGCDGFTPTVTVVFVCPREEGRYSGNRGPILLSSTNCQYQVQWQTEHACEVEMLTTDTCAFTSDTHGIDIDLSPLTMSAGEKYLASDVQNGYYYFINVCSDLAIPEGCTGMAVCQESVDGSSSTSAGQNVGHELRYTDGELTLVYRHGDVCSHNKFQRTSVISFYCNETQDPGNPEFVTETECTYFFDWHTKYACSSSAPSASCRLDSGRQRYDLSPLIRQTGSNWLVLDGRHNHGEEVETEYFINVCADIVGTDQAAATCPSGSSSCVVENTAGTKTGKSLGSFVSSPFFRDGYIAMTYTDKGTCASNKDTVTDITFLCSPGDLESAPILVRKSEDSCQYDMEWHTAAACPLASKWGTNCTVFDDDAGVSFDLSPLSKEGGYAVPVDDYNYNINVCADLQQSPCNEASYKLGFPHPAACQNRLDGSGIAYVLGQTNASLGYFDGIIKLTYLDGAPYHSNTGPGKSRMTEIAFLCDPKEDPGTPQFFQENNATYFFRWYTKYACPSEPVECVVTDETNREQYDLSSLSKAFEEENWSFVDDKDPSNRRKYYINVCRAVNPIMHCGAFAGMCQTGFTNNEESVLIPNLGIPSGPPTIESSGHLLLTYTNGSQCGSGKQVTSHIHFACNKGVLASTPRLLEVVDSCTYSFIWETEAACPIEVSEGENCTVRDLNSDYVFNLQPLRKSSAYEVTGSNGDTFKLNVCAPVTCGDDNAGACLISKSPTQSLGQVSASPVFSDEGLLTIEYNDGHFDPVAAKKFSTVISFLCRRNISHDDARPVFLRREGTRHIFNFETPLACLPESVDCLVSDAQGRQYDLSPLAKDSGNWEAVDTRSSYTTLSYHINVCRPINKGDSATATCPGGPIGACQTTTTGGAFNMGYVQAMPEATDNALSLRYVNGDICHGAYHRSTRINFECSDSPGSPVFQAETEQCEYIFTWETPAACPLQRVTGGNCSVQVPEFGYEFNLSSLYNPKQDYTVMTSTYNYTVNVCGPLVAAGGSCQTVDKSVGGCQNLEDGKSVNAGMFNKNLTYANGVLSLNYTQGAQCHNVYERSTAINFYCDENVEGKGEPHYIRETSDCTYLFEWATPIACPPFKMVECSYRDGTSQFDLAPLSKMTDNYRVQGASGGEAYFINVCRSLWHRRGSQGEFCPHNAAACLQKTDSTGKQSYISLGEVGQGPTMENGHLVLRYQSGGACPDGTGRERTTVINIQCDKNSVGSEPLLDHIDGDCEYHFLWMTNYACDITTTDAPTGDCTTTNPVSGFRFDLSSLARMDGYAVTGSDGHKYVLNICDHLTSSECVEDSRVGSCQQDLTSGGRHFNAGIFNSNLYFDDSILFLRYDDGKACHNEQFKRSTVINFVCPHKKDTLGAPVFIAESDDCTYYFSWHTSLACEKFIQCSVINGSQTINLSPLINDQGYHLATGMVNVASVTYINLCRPLNPIPGLTCNPSAAACMVKEGKPMSLGRVSEAPRIGQDGRVAITYTQGDSCPEDGTRNISSIIRFYCKQGITQGSPTLEGYADCTYEFTWGTNVVCPPTAPESDDDCTFFNTALQYRFDFSPLSKMEQSVPASSAKTIYLKMCGKPSDQSGQCKGAAVCMHADQDRFSLGQADTKTISQEDELFKVQYSNGSPCPSSSSKKRQSTILLVCDRAAVNTMPTLFSSDNDCHYTFRWSTSTACAPETRPCDIAHDSYMYDLQPLSQITGSFQFHDTNKNDYYLNLCQPAYNTPDGCPAEASMCRVKPDGTVDTLGMVYTQQLSTQGDAPNIVVSLTEGSAVKDCADPSDRTANSLETYASTNITFICANKVGSPVFQGTKLVGDTCQFQFVWESKVACAEESVPVELKDKKIVDPETNVAFDFTQIIDHGSWEARGDDRQGTADPSSYVYFITIDEQELSVPGDVTDACRDAAVCQSKDSDDRFFRDVGTRASRKFFIEDDIVEMIVTKPHSCGKDNTEDVVTTVIFQCEPSENPGNPEFYYESSNCQYHFLWLTSVVCTDGKIVIPGDGGGDQAVVNSKHKNASIIIVVLLCIILLCILAIVFHKKERRLLVFWKLRGCCPGSYSKVPNYSYSQLSNGDTDEAPEGGAQSRSLFVFEGGDEDEELLKETRANPFEFHDDSDDDILPHV